MNIIYSGQELPQSWQHAIFLAGPTPRDSETQSWRPEALKILEDLGYGGVVFLPEGEGGGWPSSYAEQVAWEKRGLEMSDCIVFWVPRNLVSMPAFTTNVEFGRAVDSGKAVLGFPEGTPKMRYLEWMAGDSAADVPVWHSLRETLQEAIQGWDNVEPRRGGERYVPIDVWDTPMFRSWYKQLREIGNRLEEAKILWVFRMPKKRTVFSYVMQVKIWVSAEQRWKENEWVFARMDIACAVLYHTPNGSQDLQGLLDTEVVLIREFRSPGRTADGFIHEMPGGAAEAGDSSRDAASREVYEETGLAIPRDRFRYVGSRQAAATVSSHKVHCYAVDLTRAEMAQAKALVENGSTFGDEEDSERTHLEVRSLREILQEELVDWSMVGSILGSLINT